MVKGRYHRPKKATAGANGVPGNQPASTSGSASQNIETLNSVDQLVLHWHQLNEFVPQNLDEVFNLCLASETCLYTATKTFKPLQLAVFKRKIRELGGEVETCEIHYHRARGFGEKVSDRLLESDLDPLTRDKALENLKLLAHLQDQYGATVDASPNGIEPRASLFQARRIAKLVNNTRLLRSLLDQSSSLELTRSQSKEQQRERSQRSTRFSDRARALSSSASDPESDDSLTSSKLQKQVELSPSESHVKDLAEPLLPVETEAKETKAIATEVVETKASKANDQSAGTSLIDDIGPLEELDQNTSHEVRLAREELAFQQLGNQEVDICDLPGEDITEQETFVESSLADDSIIKGIIHEDTLHRCTDADELIGEVIEIKSTQVLSDQKDKTVKISVCLNPKTLEPTAQKLTDNLPARDTTEKATLEMAIAAEVSLPLPPLPLGWSGNNGKDFKSIGNISTSTLRSVEPVGPYYLAHARRARHKRTFSEDDRIQAQESVKTVEDSDDGEISEVEDPSMLLRDAKDWKGQDHYAVLGLSKHRWRATEEQIKRAHRKKVLRHHPDKKAAAGSTEDDSFFKCIQKATEILLDPVKRRQFDSVDEAADVEPPTKKQTQKGNFYKLWGPVFKAEGRFSKTQPVPKLGDEKSTKEDVENFYNYWYNFDSWRSFEYQDEDVPDDNENRDQKRHMERKNNNARKKKKTEDSARLRKLLDDCSALDERIKKFRQEANASKNKKRLEKEAAEKKAAEDAKLKKEADEKVAKEAEEVAKVEREQGKKAKEAAKNAVKKNKRVLKASVKDANYFVTGSPPAATIDSVLNDVELVQAKVDADEIAALAGKLTGLKVSDEIKAVWKQEVKRLIDAGKLKDGDIKTFA